MKERRLGSLGCMMCPVRRIVRNRSFGIGLAARLSRGKRLELRGRCVDLADARIWRQIDSEAARIEDLRHDADVGQRRLRAKPHWSRQLLEPGLDRVKATLDPVLRPFCP